MQKLWFKTLELARHLSRAKNKRTEIFLSTLDIARLDSGETVMYDNGEIHIILTSEKHPIDTPQE